MAAVGLEAFFQIEGRHHVEPAALPSFKTPEFLFPEDVAEFVEHAIAHRQVVSRFQRVAGIYETSKEHNYSSLTAKIAGRVVLRTYNTSIRALDLFAPLAEPETGWHDTVASLAAEATEQGIDFVHELNL